MNSKRSDSKSKTTVKKSDGKVKEKKETKEKSVKGSVEKVESESLKAKVPPTQPKDKTLDLKVKEIDDNTKVHEEKVPLESSLKSPEKSVKIATTPEQQDEAEAEGEKSPEKVKVELKIERKKSPRKPKVNIFLEDSDEVDEFESIPLLLDVKSKWSSPTRPTIPLIVPAPMMEHKMKFPDIPVVIESPEKSPVTPIPSTESIFESSSVTIEKSPTPSPPPKPSKVRNVCSFLSDIASGNMFSGLGLGSGLYDDDHSIAGLNLENYKVEAEVKPPEGKKFNNLFDVDRIMEPDTTADKVVEKAAPLMIPSDADSDSDSDSDTSSSSDSDSDDTTSESEESSDESSDDDVPTFTRGFGRFDASTMPMVTQISPTTATSIATPTATVVTSRFQPHQQSLIKPPGLLTSVTKPTMYTPQIQPVATPFSFTPGQFPFPIPFKIYSLRDNNIFPSAVPFPVPAPVVVTPTATDKTEKEKKPAEKDKRDRDRKRSRSHSRDRDKKRLKDDRRKSPIRRRSHSPAKKRHDDRGRQVEERKDARRRDSSPRHGSHSSRVSHGSRFASKKIFSLKFSQKFFF